MMVKVYFQRFQQQILQFQKEHKAVHAKPHVKVKGSCKIVTKTKVHDGKSIKESCTRQELELECRCPKFQALNIIMSRDPITNYY